MNNDLTRPRVFFFTPSVRVHAVYAVHSLNAVVCRWLVFFSTLFLTIAKSPLGTTTVFDCLRNANLQNETNPKQRVQEWAGLTTVIR